MAAEFFDHCQICGSEHKSSSAIIAKHGYTIRSGWQEGACYGSSEKPIEVSSDLIEGALERAQRYIYRTKIEIEELRINPLHNSGRIKMRVRTGTGTGETYTIELATVEFNAHDEPVALGPSGKLLKTWPRYGAIKTVADANKDLASLQISYLEKTVGQAEEHIVYLTNVLDQWVPLDLRAVTEADKALSSPKLHYGATKYRLNTSACAMSVSSAKKWRHITSDRSLVTCIACLKFLTCLDELPRRLSAEKEKIRLRDIKLLKASIQTYSKFLAREKVDLAAIAHWSAVLAQSTMALELLVSESQA
jgi:hypothetical protein